MIFEGKPGKRRISGQVFLERIRGLLDNFINRLFGRVMLSFAEIMIMFSDRMSGMNRKAGGIVTCLVR